MADGGTGALCPQAVRAAVHRAIDKAREPNDMNTLNPAAAAAASASAASAAAASAAAASAADHESAANASTDGGASTDGECTPGATPHGDGPTSPSAGRTAATPGGGLLAVRTPSDEPEGVHELVSVVVCDFHAVSRGTCDLGCYHVV